MDQQESLMREMVKEGSHAALCSLIDLCADTANYHDQERYQQRLDACLQLQAFLQDVPLYDKITVSGIWVCLTMEYSDREIRVVASSEHTLDLYVSSWQEDWSWRLACRVYEHTILFEQKCFGSDSPMRSE